MNTVNSEDDDVSYLDVKPEDMVPIPPQEKVWATICDNLELEYIDREMDEETDRLGWLTTAQSKPILVDGLKTLLRAGQSGIRWIGTVREATTFVYDKRGRMNAQSGCFDDQLMSYMIAQEMRARMPARVVRDNTPRKSKHWMAH